MGCGASKCGEGDIVNLCKREGCIVSLCKERKDLIRAARESRNAVSASHVLYLQSLLDFGEALDALLKEAIVDHHSCSSEVDSPLHSVEGTRLEVLSVESGPVSSLTDEVHQGVKDGKTKLSSVDRHENENQILKHEIVSRSMRSSPQAVTELHDPGKEFHASMGYIPTAPPMCSHLAQNNHWFPAYGIRAHPRGTMNTHYNEGYNFSNYVDGSSCNYSADSSAGQRLGQYGSEQSMGYFRGMRQDYQPDALTKPIPVPSPPMANSAMDYFNVLSFTDNIYSSYYSRNTFDDGIESVYPYLNNALEEEEKEIPPLEQTAEELPSKPFYTSKGVNDTQLDAHRGTSGAQAVGSNERQVKGGKTCNHIRQGEEIVSINPSVGKDDNGASTSFSTDNGEQKGGKTTSDDAKHSSKLKQAIVVKHPVIDIFETIQEISQAFLTAYNGGKEVTDILEVEKIPYLPMGSALKGSYHIIPKAIEPSTVSSQKTYALRKKSACKILKKTSIGSSYTVKDISYTQGTMTSTLDKLCAWEKKLYKEVKIEEELREAYEELNKRCKMLVNKGADPQRIEAMQLKIKRLVSEIDVSVSSIRAISKRVHQAMNEELHRQLLELIHGLSRMRKSMSQCHRSQVQAAMDAKQQHNVAKMLHLDMKLTDDLKLKVLKWRSSLCDLIHTEKAFATFLVKWLSKFRSENKDWEEDDMVHPFSPCRTDDPVIAILCRGWLQALEATTVSRASEALEEFALALHNLWKKQSEEQALRLRVEFLETHVNAYCKASSPRESGNAQEVDTAWKILGEQKAAHAVVFDQLKYEASSCVTDCLVKVFSALECFCTDMSNSYDQIS